MATFSFAALKQPIPGENACGISLEDINDNEFMQFVARVEGLLPETFSKFDRAAVDFNAEFSALKSLLSRSIDLRLLVPLAKLSILDRNLDGFDQALDAIRDCLETRWDSVHPVPIDGDPIMRLITLQSLDDMPHTILPFQYVPLFKARRFGTMTFRGYLIASGKLPANPASEDETKLQSTDIGTAVEQADLAEINASRIVMARICASLDAIELSYNAHAGANDKVELPRLKSIAADIARFLDESAISKDPSLAPASVEDVSLDEAPDPETGQGSAAALKSMPQARRALGACLHYFSVHEASSPARLILKQAQALVGKSFFEALQVLTPDYANQASVKLGKNLPLNLSIGALSELLSSDDGEERYPQASGDDESEHVYLIASREQALDLLQKIGTFFKAREPSSPIPMLLEQARSVVGRDFTNLLREVLPANAFRIDE